MASVSMRIDQRQWRRIQYQSNDLNVCISPDAALRVAVAGDYAYVADDAGGLAILRLLRARAFVPLACRR
ncbi:MAG: hypothetical protein J7M15_01240, partial [Anaerolineae bacterium]|nr:hypothetical protein [Anaerolineae bacterium]